MSIIAEIQNRLSGVAILKERLTETNRNVERTLTWLLEHEKRLIHLEASRASAPITPPTKRLPRR